MLVIYIKPPFEFRSLIESLGLFNPSFAKPKNVICNPMRHPTNIGLTDKMTTKSQHFAKLKEVEANTQSQRFCATFSFTPTHQSPPHFMYDFSSNKIENKWIN